MQMIDIHYLCTKEKSVKLSLIILASICLTGCSNPGDEFVTVQRSTKTKVVKVSDHDWHKLDGQYVITGRWTPASPEDAKKVHAYINSK